MKSFIKWAIVGICVLCIFFGIGGYVVYRNRAAIASKAMNYAMQSLTGSPEDGTQTWLGALIEGDSSQDVKNALIKSVMKRGGKLLADKQENNETTDNTVKRKPGLATMADMLVNGAGGEGADLGQMAQALLGSLTEKTATPQQCGNDINARDTKGRTLLMNVCRVDVTPKVIKMLLRFGADINAVDDNGRNALMYAVALNENPEVVEMLLENGADANHADNQGQTVLDYAKIDEIRDIVRKYTKSKGWFF
jgi:hypothetical protein